MDARKKKVLSVLCVASLVLVWRGYAVITKFKPSKAKADPAVTAVDFGSTESDRDAAYEQEDLTGVLEQQEDIANQSWGRDPFADVSGAVRERQPVSVEAEVRDEGPPPEPPPLEFSGVSKSDGRWLAVVRRRIVGVGDVIDGEYKIVEITKRSITLASGRWSLRYELGSDDAVVRPLVKEQ